MNQEKSMEAHTSAAEASTPPVRMGGRGLPHCWKRQENLRHDTGR